MEITERVRAEKKSGFAKAYAKVNLSLAVGERAKNGYHTVDTVMLSVPIADEITLTPRTDNTVTVSYGAGEVFKRDTAVKAAQFMMEKYNLPGADIVIKKNIPVAAGLGGSSADAAGVIRCYEEIYNIRVPAADLLEVGSDVAFMKEGGAARVGGFGEKIEPISAPALYIALLLDRRIAIDTSSAYALYDILGGEAVDVAAFIKNYNNPANSLETAAAALEPGILTLKETLKAAGFTNIVMTGSGGGVLAYTKERESFVRAAANLKKKIEGEKGLRLFTFQSNPIDTEKP